MTEENNNPVAEAVATTEVREYWDNPHSRSEFLGALAAAQAGFTPIAKNRTVVIKPREGPTYTFRFADLESIQNATRPALAATGLSTTCQILNDPDGAWIRYTLAHTGGFERVSSLFVKRGDDPKQFGAIVSYLRRYMAQAILDVAADDDLDENGQGAGEGGAGANVPSDRNFDKPPAPKPARKSAATAQQQAQAVQPTVTATNATPAPQDGPPAGMFEDEPAAERPALELKAQTEADLRAKAEREAAAQAQQQPAAAVADDDGELAEEGERNFLIKRAKSRSPDGSSLAKALAQLGLKHDPATLLGLTRKQWSLVRPLV